MKGQRNKECPQDFEYLSASQQKEKTGKEAPGRAGPLLGYSHEDGSGALPGDELAVTAAKISIHRIIDSYSHH